jgi:hypothetical protein
VSNRSPTFLLNPLQYPLREMGLAVRFDFDEPYRPRHPRSTRSRYPWRARERRLADYSQLNDIAGRLSQVLDRHPALTYVDRRSRAFS